MQNESVNVTKKLKCTVPVISLLITSFVFVLISCAQYFLHFNQVIISPDVFYYQITLGFNTVIQPLKLILSLAPCVLLFIYIIKFWKKDRAPVLYTVTCGLITIESLLLTAMSVKNIFLMGISFDSVLPAICFLALAVCFILLTVSSLMGWNKKILSVTALLISACIAIGTIIQIATLKLPDSVDTFALNHMYFMHFMGAIGLLAFFIFFLIFNLANSVPAVIVPKDKNKGSDDEPDLEQLSTEERLILLENNLAMGKITQEEYQTLRAEIDGESEITVTYQPSYIKKSEPTESIKEDA